MSVDVRPPFGSAISTPAPLPDTSEKSPHTPSSIARKIPAIMPNVQDGSAAARTEVIWPTANVADGVTNRVVETKIPRSERMIRSCMKARL